MKFESFKEKLGSWADSLRLFIESEQCNKIYAQLKKDSQKDTIFPTSEDTFRAFKLCDKSNLKLILYGMEPYSGVYHDNKKPQATGLCLDCSNGKIQPSLEYFLKGISNEYNLPYTEYYKTNDLSYLAEQGILLVNRSLTVKKEKIGSHIGLWDEFWEFFLEKLQSEHPNTPILFLGKDASHLKKYVWELSNPIFELPHPSSAARTQSNWETKNIFSNINQYLRTHHDYAINWSWKKHDEIKVNLAKENDNLAKLKDDLDLPF